jgi:hypothetical protein
MSRAANHFHAAQSLLASIEGELCGLLKQVNKEANDDSQTFDKKWMPHLDRIAELATMHSKINEHYSNHLISMFEFKEMCIAVNSIVSIPGMKPFPADGPIVSTRMDARLSYMVGIASRVWNETHSYDIVPYDFALSEMGFKQTFVEKVNERINLCDKTIERIEWYIQTLQTLISNFDAIGETKIPTVVKKILKPGCVIFHITESDPLSTLKSLVQRATELLHMKEHPDAFSRTTAIKMMRESDRAKRRSEVHKMMATVYASKPTLSQNPYDYGTDPSFGEAMAEAEARAQSRAKAVAAAKRRSEVHKMMAAVYASKPTWSQNPYNYGTYPPFGEALEEAEAMAKADAEEAAAVRLAFVKPKPKTKKCSMMGGRIKRKSKKRNSR